jgi:amino acid transporter, AAT family
VIGVLINLLAPDQAFTYITSVATVAILWVWGMIAVCHLRFHAERDGSGVPRNHFRLPGAPWANYLILAYLALVAALLAVTPDQRVAIAAGAVWAALLALGWWRIRRRRAGAAPAPG